MLLDLLDGRRHITAGLKHSLTGNDPGDQTSSTEL
jgi:hypothetical protein